MATFSHKIFGQLLCTTGESTLFQVPASHEYIIDEFGITISNSSTTTDYTVRIARVDGGTTTANEDWVIYDLIIARQTDVHGVLAGAAFAATDSVVVQASGGSYVAVSVSGLDIDSS